MTNAITVSAPSNGSVGSGLAILGTVSPGTDPVSLQLSQQNATLPTGAWQTGTTTSGNFAGVLTPPGAGTWYAWAYDQLTGLSAVSGAIQVPNPNLSLVQTVPLSFEQVEDLEGGAASGLTVDALPAAAATSDTDTALVGQGTKSLFGQTFAAIWTWISGKLPSYLLPQVNLATAGNVMLQNPTHNGRLLVVTVSGVQLVSDIPSMGPGFNCDVVNASGATVALSGVTTSTGASVIAIGETARILAFTAPSGTLTVFARL